MLSKRGKYEYKNINSITYGVHNDLSLRSVHNSLR